MKNEASEWRNYFQSCANSGFVSRINKGLIENSTALTNRKTNNPTENFQTPRKEDISPRRYKNG